ncbi:MAG: hypothetical protein JO323_11035 [Acidobacteriia bacterium]|nr:hypothetical protein [Terriglobia bacterium]
MRPLKPARFRKVGLYLLFWTALGLLEFLQTSGQIAANHTRIPWQPLLVTWLGGMYLVALTVPAVWWLGGHFPLERRSCCAASHCISRHASFGPPGNCS